MVELHILAGKQAGSQSVVRRFPFRIGRAGGNDLQLTDDGAWDQHLTLEFHRHEGFRLVTAQNALVMVNGKPVVRDSKILTLDEPAILAKAAEYRLKVSDSLKH